MEILKVSAKTDVNKAAGAIAGVMRGDGRVEVQAIGAAAVNQAIKAITTTRGFVAPSGIDLIIVPGFRVLEIDGEERTSICLTVEKR